MYPTIEFLGIKIFTFGTLIAMTWLLFMTLLHHFSWKEGFTRSIFSDRALVTFTLSILFFGRIWNLFTEWRDGKFIFMELGNGNFLEFARLFFTPDKYPFTLFGGIFGFFLIFFWRTHDTPHERRRYFDAVIYAFLYSALLGYFAAFLGGQIYGIPLDSFLSVTYSHKESIIVTGTPFFPLALFYLITTSLIIYGVHLFRKKLGQLPEGFAGYLGLGLFSSMIFLGEFFNGSEDMFESYFHINLNQIGALIGIIISLLGILGNIEKKN